jgi:hypothetical protein
LRINHSLPDAPKYLLFLACDPDELKATLSAARFEVFEANPGEPRPGIAVDPRLLSEMVEYKK